jgi:tetratricopeptide (TPR) repeat protein
MDAGLLQVLREILAGPKRQITILYIVLVFPILAILGVIGISAVSEGWIALFQSLAIIIFLLLIGFGTYRLAYHRPLHMNLPSDYKEKPTFEQVVDAVAASVNSGRPQTISSTETILTVHAQMAEGDQKKDEPEPNLAELPAGDSDKEDSWRTVLFRELMAEDGDLAKAEEAYRHVQEAEEDPNRKHFTELVYLYNRFGRGDQSALERLEDLAEDNEVSDDFKSDRLFMLGRAYQRIASNQKASDAYEQSLAFAPDASGKARAIAGIANTLFRRGQPEEALQTVEEAIANTSDTDAKAILYQRLADQFDETGQQELRALALEKILEYRPSDNTVRFKAAWAYSEANLNHLALYHYGIVLNTSPNDDWTHNNEAVEYIRLEMKTLAVSAYRKASDLGNTLAAANLAYQLLGAGFTDEAMKLLDEARLKEDPHPNVGQAIAAVAQAKQRDKETEEKVTKAAREQRYFMLAYADALFLQTDSTSGFAGSWLSDEGVPVTIVRTEQGISASWTIKDRNYSFSGTPNRGTAKIDSIQWTSSSGYSLERVADKGYAYLSEDGRSIRILGIGGNENVMMQFHRNGQSNGSSE